MKKIGTFFLTFFLSVFFGYSQNAILLETEAFDNYGGWLTDAQFMDQMGSPYMLAHGLGEPVKDASTTIDFPQTGKYKIFVRTRDWVAPYGPGQFEILINNKPLKTTFGDKGNGEWFWQDGGNISVTNKTVAISLHDKTGFDGRCDAILFVRNAPANYTPPADLTGLKKLRAQVNGVGLNPDNAGNFDLVVVGGGFAGICASVAAARLGLKVALIQNRNIVGGNASSEVRVNPIRKAGLPPYTHNADIVNQLLHPQDQKSYSEDLVDTDAKRLEVVTAEKNITLFLNTHANKVEMKEGRIVAIVAQNVKTGKTLRFTAPLFADCTGDANIGYLAGADYRMGRESKTEFNESLAPDKPDSLYMGNTQYWYLKDAGVPSNFPTCKWALQIDKDEHYMVSTPKWPMPIIPGILATSAWNWESGFREDNITRGEFIRDYNLRAIFGTVDYLKNKSPEKEKYKNGRLMFAAHVIGKRDSRRLVGDVILTQNDIVKRTPFPDSCVATHWYFDIHYPHPENSQYFPDQEFRSVAYDDPKWEKFRNGQPGNYLEIDPYPIPFRCLYSRNIPNLLMAGRNISVSRVALASVRVMKTTGEMGTVVGRAAYILRKHNADPKMIFEKYLDEFRAVLSNPAQFEVKL